MGTPTSAYSEAALGAVTADIKAVTDGVQSQISYLKRRNCEINNHTDITRSKHESLQTRCRYQRRIFDWH